MSYHRQEEVRRLIENYVSWKGDGVVQGPRGCIIRRAERAIMAKMDPRPTPRTLGIEAGRTEQALSKMVGKHRGALLVFYTSSLTFELQARDRLRISKSEYHRRLDQAHPIFIELYELEREQARARREEWAAAR